MMDMDIDREMVIESYRNRIAELEAENARLKTCLVASERQFQAQFVHIDAALDRAEAAEAKVARVEFARKDWLIKARNNEAGGYAYCAEKINQALSDGAETP